jgi:hypothetical protein
MPTDRSQIDQRLVTLEKRVYGLADAKRNSENPCNEVSGSARKHADWYVTVGELPYDLHHSPVAAQGEDGVVVTAALVRYLPRVTGSLGEHDVAHDSATRERRPGLRLAAPASSRPGIDDE